jgi:hypothetical protein
LARSGKLGTRAARPEFLHGQGWNFLIADKGLIGRPTGEGFGYI